MNTHAIFSKACSTIIYSSNRDGRVRPFVVDMKNPARPRVAAIDLPDSRSFIAQSLAPDCRTLAMVSDHGGDGLFEIFLFDLTRSTLRRITAAPGRDEGKPLFAPRGHLLAYLTDGRLALYDYRHAIQLPAIASPNRFQTVTWSDDGATLFLEDDRFDIWQYDSRTSVIRKVWSAANPGYVTRTISDRRKRLLFTSDHETPFRQIYSLDLQGGSLKRLYPTQHDQFSPVELGAGDYTLRTNVDANFSALELVNGKPQLRSPAAGVVYDFSLAFGPPLLLYSNDHLPTSLYWFVGGALKPLLPIAFDARQPAAIPINSDGVTNFLYLPSRTPRALLVWLHGGPHEQVSPRYNLYFDFLARMNIAVYAINFPGSTGFGKDYAMYGRPAAATLPLQLSSIDQDLRQLGRLKLTVPAFFLVGVSYGSILAHLLIATHPEFSRLVDFSGIADDRTIPDPGAKAPSYPSVLFIYGDRDEFSKLPERQALIARYRGRTKVASLVLPQEGHFISRRDSIDRILKSLGAFLLAPVAR